MNYSNQTALSSDSPAIAAFISGNSSAHKTKRADKKRCLDSPEGRRLVTTTGTAQIAAVPAALSTSSPQLSLQ